MMRNPKTCLALALLCCLAMGPAAHATALITDFNNFASDALYAAWSTGTIVSGPDSYDITASGYGSNYKYIGWPVITGAGNTAIELTVTLEGPSEADGLLGPIVQLIDGDGTSQTYAWYGQTLGSHVLTMPIGNPALDLNTLTHMHMQLDPSSFGGSYTVKWENLSLVPEPASALLMAAGLLVLGIRRR